MRVTLEVRLPRNRDFAGTLRLGNCDSLFGPIPIAGRSDDLLARLHQNSCRDPLLPYGDTPTGTYLMRAVFRASGRTEYYRLDYGAAGAFAFEPVAGDAALADANGRFVLLLHGTKRVSESKLYATSGALRVLDSDLLDLMRMIRGAEGPIYLEIVETEHYSARVYQPTESAFVEDPPLIGKEIGAAKDKSDREGLTRRAALARTALLAMSPGVFSVAGPSTWLPLGQTTAYSAGPNIVDSVSGFFNRAHPETKGYGRYTYVLFAAKSDRSATFIRDLLMTTPTSESSETTRVNLNIFEMPMFDRLYQELDPAFLEKWPPQNLESFIAQVTSQYDYALSRDTLNAICLSPKPPGVCKTARADGPYLLTFSRPIDGAHAVPTPYLSVDLSLINATVFPYFIDGMKQQVRASNITDESRIFSTRAQVLAVIANLVSWFPSIENSVSHVMEIIK